MSFHESSLERFSETPGSDRLSDIRVIDLRDPSRRQEEETPNEQEKERQLLSLSEIANARMKYMQVLFEKGAKTHDALLATELIEESRYWMEDVEQELEFIREYREETGEEQAFTKAAASLAGTKKELTSHLEYMLATVRKWNEERLASSAAERVSDEAEGIFEDFADEGLIIDEAPPAETMLNAANETTSTTSTSSEPTFLPNGYHEETTEELADEKTEETLGNVSSEETRILQKEQGRSSGVIEAGTFARSPAFEYQGTPEETREKYKQISQVIQRAEQDMERQPTFDDRERFDDYLITLSHAYADFADRLNMIKTYVIRSEEVKKEETLINEILANIQDVRKRIHALQFPNAELSLVEIPGMLDETIEKCSAVSRMVKRIEQDISRAPSAAIKKQLPEYIIALSREHTAFEERLDILNQAPSQSAEVQEEKALIGEALEKIQDARHHIRRIQYAIPADEQLDIQIELRTAKKNKLERIAKRLTSALERGGIEHPELYMLEQSSGLGTIRRGLMKVFGKQEPLINKTTLTKLRKEAIEAEEDYFDNAYTVDETGMPMYQKARDRNPILRLQETSDVHELWQALNQELEELGEQLDSSLDRNALRAPASAKVAIAETDAFKSSLEGKALKKQREEGQDLNEASRTIEQNNIRASGITDATELIHAIKENPNARYLTFLPEDYLSAIAELKQANSAKDLPLIKKLLPRARSMKDEMNEAWMDLTNEDGELFSDEAILNRSRILIGMAEEKKPAKKK